MKRFLRSFVVAITVLIVCVAFKNIFDSSDKVLAMSVIDDKVVLNYEDDTPTPTPIHLHAYYSLNYNDGIPVVNNYDSTLDDGWCGDYVQWELNDQGILKIFGTGEMYDFVHEDMTMFATSPWARKLVKSVVIEEGVTGLGAYSFFLMNSIESISIPSSVTRFGSKAFYGCSSLKILNGERVINSKVTNLNASPYSYNSIKLDWNTMQDASGYVIYQTSFIEYSELWASSLYQVKEVGNKNSCIITEYEGYDGYFRIAPVVQINNINVELSPFCWTYGHTVDTNSSGKNAQQGSSPCINGVKVKTLNVALPGVIEIEIDVYDPDSTVQDVYVNVGDALANGDNELTDYKVDFSQNDEGRILAYYLLSDWYESSRYWKLEDLYIRDSQGNLVGCNPYYDEYNWNKAHVYNEFDVEFNGVLSNPYVANELKRMDEGKTVVLRIDKESEGILKKECLDAIKGQDKSIVIYCDDAATMQWVFYGKDIKGDTKDIDVRVSINPADATKFGGTGTMPEIVFADNGNLPGWSNFRFKSTYIKTQFKLSDELFLYYFSQGKVSLENTDCKLLRGGDQYWCYLPISHNSTYYLSGQKLNNNIKNKDIALSSSSFVYDGKVKTPDVTVKSGSAVLKKDVDYTVAYSSGRKEIGTYKVTVTGKGSFTGSKTVSFKIVSPDIGLKLDKASGNVICGKTISLKAKLTNSKEQITWKSSNKSIATVDSKGKVTTKQAGKVTITASVASIKATCDVTVLYKDVTNTKDFWYAPTNYLTANGVVKGYDKQTKFKPANDCTRAQMLTFMWRLQGEPDPKSKTCKFPDVKKSDYFFKPVIWAVEQGITTGYKDGTFKPQNVCTRAQTVTFLWRMAEQPKPSTTKNKFSDVKKSDYFYKAVLWASGKKIVAGYDDGTFKPQGKCLRRQMVTFLYKYDKYINGKG